MRILHRHRLCISRAICALALVALACLCLPATAWAKSYTVSRVDIDATLAADGSLSVTERRTYQFSGMFQGIYWDVPRGSYQGRSIDTRLVSVTAEVGERELSFAQAPAGIADDGGLAGTYELAEQADCLRLKLYLPVNGDTVTYQVAYEMPQLATRWGDVGELYWQYVPADADATGEWHKVTATVHLPAPIGEPVKPGDNVRAWGHGPLDGELRFEGADVIFYAPDVGADEFLEARVAFPAPWLSELSPSQELRLEVIGAEEEQWVRDANRRRLLARLAVYGVPVVLVLLGVGSVFAALIAKRRRKKKAGTTQFTEKYLRDVPTDDHPAVLGKLYREGRVDGRDFSATLMRLADAGWIEADTVQVERTATRGRKAGGRAWRLLLHADAAGHGRTKGKDANGAIDTAAFAFLHDDIADKHKHVIDQSLMGPQGEPYVLMSFFDETAEKWPDAYRRGYERWNAAVQSAYDQRHFATKGESGLFPGILGLADLALAVLLCIVGMLMGCPSWPLSISFILCFGCGVYVIMSDEDEPQLVFSQEAVEIQAKLAALKRWLEDFTRLEEALPTDVMLWNRLLVMATVLGVADKVVRQLKVRLPEVLRDPASIACTWYDLEERDGLDPLARTLTRSLAAANPSSTRERTHDVSSADIASSHDSSPRGGGGGFSGGGGGGFSGGGRGGAF